MATKFYSQPTYGGSFQVFKGSRRQKGGSITGAFDRFATPILKQMLDKAMTRAEEQGKGLAGDVIKGLFRFRSPRQTVMLKGKERALNFAENMLGDTVALLKNRIGAGAPPCKRRRLH